MADPQDDDPLRPGGGGPPAPPGGHGTGRGAEVGLIWAQTLDGVIGADNDMPWRLPEDLEHFRATTLGHPVVMGRRTWDALPPRFRPLPGRRNIVVTRDPQWAADGAERAGSVGEALELAAGSPAPAAGQVWVIGGGQIYRAAMEYAVTLSVTEIDLSVAGDTYAPAPGPGWSVVEEQGWRPSTSGLRYRILRYERRRPGPNGGEAAQDVP
ncbi:dihydrofolate reductase [Kitasatospora sp. CM 4170]|uniref:dihydrofolate reductase n=1 Tax=Kitasatospora aburaviensis TaxID=67265 RepID=A0ABW1EY50_9ACTN|nr:dihydrofolate reductase [Kitasatospora sp. CM 4170]WNM43764.1 dihydrofolate reductase [Kitasatospora sp. CM 4170]